jgi:hypothetical protein
VRHQLTPIQVLAICRASLMPVVHCDPTENLNLKVKTPSGLPGAIETSSIIDYAYCSTPAASTRIIHRHGSDSAVPGSLRRAGNPREPARRRGARRGFTVVVEMGRIDHPSGPRSMKWPRREGIQRSDQGE